MSDMTLHEYPDIPPSCTHLQAEFLEIEEIELNIPADQFADEGLSFEILRADFSEGTLKGVLFHIIQHRYSG